MSEVSITPEEAKKISMKEILEKVNEIIKDGGAAMVEAGFARKEAEEKLGEAIGKFIEDIIEFKIEILEKLTETALKMISKFLIDKAFDHLFGED